MVKRNVHLAKLHSGYLFPEINKRKLALLEKNPQAQIISLGIGDTTEPIPFSIVKGLEKAASNLGKISTYSGYGQEQGLPALREKIAKTFYKEITADEIFISDGSKCDIGRLQLLFGPNITMAVQDPSYPAYVDTSVACGQTGSYDTASSQYQKVVYLPCTPENNFFPSLDFKADIIYFCSPNNPTGIAATAEQLTALVAHAKKIKAVLIFDAAYASYIRNPDLPKSIYEIPGAKDVAIELNSFSKMAGFTGVRLGWATVPDALSYEDGSSIRKDWLRIATTFFNGASTISQQGGLQALEATGLKEMEAQTSFYLKNAEILKQSLLRKDIQIFGGTHAPYLWAHFPGRKSWDVFAELLEKLHLLTTPGIGFGPGGEGFIRFSAFGHRENILEAKKRLAFFYSS